jgi:hypothetical protein
MNKIKNAIIYLTSYLKHFVLFLFGQRYLIEYKPYGKEQVYTYIIGRPSSHTISKAGNKLFTSFCFSGRMDSGVKQFRYDRIAGGLSPV